MISARKIKEARKDLGESQAVFGVRFGVDQSTIHRWETKKPPQSGPAAKLLHQFLSEDRELPPPGNGTPERMS